jgi:hypothetical protein
VWVWPYDPAIIGKSGFFKFTSFNTLGNMEQSLASATAYAYTVKGTAAVSGTEALDELIHTGTSDGTAGAKSIHRFSTTTYAIVSGDELHYDVFFDPTSPSATGGIDFEYGAGHSLFSAAGINDQNGKAPSRPPTRTRSGSGITASSFSRRSRGTQSTAGHRRSPASPRENTKRLTRT